MLPDEVELATCQKTNFYDNHIKIIHDSVCLFTSQRLIFLPKETEKSFAFPLINHRRITTHHPWFKTPKIEFFLRDTSNDDKYTNPVEIDQSFYPATETTLSPRNVLLIGIADGKIQTFAQHIDQARLALIDGWKARAKQKKEETTANYGVADEDRARNLGVAGILHQRKEKAQIQQSQLSEAAGADLDSLMKQALQVTVVLEKLSQRALAQQQRQQQQQQQQGAPGTSDTAVIASGNDQDMSQSEQQDLTNVLEQIGFISPVTKQSSGNRYHEELSRQLFDFAQHPVKVSHGTIGLVDLYCLYNRARGTELVSPQDVLKACQLWETLFPARNDNNQNSNKVTLKLKQLQSKGYIIQSSSYNENYERMRMQQYIFARNCGLSGKGAIPIEQDVPNRWKSEDSKGVSVLEISQFFKISIPFAQEHLDVLLTNDKIVKDNSSAAVLYYHNFFLVDFLSF
jgi:hypothetical protein